MDNCNDELELVEKEVDMGFTELYQFKNVNNSRIRFDSCERINYCSCDCDQCACVFDFT